MPGAGELRERWTFQQRGLDANQDRRGAWEEGFTVAAKIVWLRGGDAVLQDRLNGKQPVVLTIRDSRQAREIRQGWRALDARAEGRVAHVTSVAPSRDRGFIDVLATVGESEG